MENMEIRLANPGAGLGALEMLSLKTIKVFWMRHPSLERAIAQIRSGERALEAELKPFAEWELTTRVLVPRPWFVEDSSRYWSPAMLFRHINKVNGAVAKAIEMKVNLVAEPTENSIQRLKAVKPEVELNAGDEIMRFRESVSRLIEAAESSTIRDLEHLTIPHPWLKQLTYLQWLWFAGFHMRVHAKQLGQIYKGGAF